MLMVILGHQFEKTRIGVPLQFIQTFHMPMFFMIAGYFISERLMVNEYSIKRSKRLLIPYVITCLVADLLCSIVVMLKEHEISIAMNEFIKRLWITIYGSGSGHGSIVTRSEIGMMWYLLGLLWSSIVVKAICKNKFAGIIALLISSIAIGSTTIFGWIPLSFQSGLGAVMWVWIGYYVKKNELLDEIKRFVVSPWILLIFVAWILSAVYGVTHLYGNYYRLGVVDAVGAVAGSLLIFGLCEAVSEKESWFRKCLAWIGVNSLLIYCLHFLENNVMPVDRVLKVVGLSDLTLIALLSWLIIVVLCCLLVMVLKRIQIVKVIFG